MLTAESSLHHTDSCCLSHGHCIRSTTQTEVGLAAHKAKLFLAQDLFQVIVPVGVAPRGGADGHDGVQAIGHFLHLAENSRDIPNGRLELHNR